MTLNAEITTKDEDISTKKLTVVGYVGRKSKNKIELEHYKQLFPQKNNPKYG